MKYGMLSLKLYSQMAALKPLISELQDTSYLFCIWNQSWGSEKSDGADSADSLALLDADSSGVHY